MDTTKTRADLVILAADELEIVGDGQSLEDDDRVKIDARVDGLLGELAARGILFIANEGYIPSDYCGPLATLLAVEVAPTFGKQRDYAARQDAEDRLRIMVQRAAPTNQYLETDKFLRMRGAGYSYTQWQRGG